MVIHQKVVRFLILFICCGCAPVIIWDGRFPASIPEKSCRKLIRGAALDHLYAEMLNSGTLHRSYKSVEVKKNAVAYPEIPSFEEVSIVKSRPQRVIKNTELSPGLSSGILERVREVGGVFDDYKKVSDAKPRPLSMAEKMDILRSSQEFSERVASRDGLTEIEKERLFLKDVVEKLYDFEKDLLEVKLTPKGFIPTPNFDFPGLGKNHAKAYEYVQGYWSSLVKRTPEKTQGSILPLPFEFPVANATRFDEMYYWDTYFGLHGLMNSGHLELSQKTVENFLYMIRNYGLIPNGNRDYYLSRSQPPFISSMVKDVYEASLRQQPERASELKKWLRERAYPLLKKDLENFWMNPKTRFDESTGLHHHFDEVNLARPERHSADKELADSWDDPQGLGIDYVDTRAVAESGLDFTDVLGKEAAQAANPLLNSMIYKYTKDLELMARELGLVEEAQKYARMAEKKKQAMNRYLWDAETGAYRTYHMGKKEFIPGIHAETFTALFAGVADDDQAKAMLKTLERLEKEGGVMSSDQLDSHHQWDGLNGWAPLHFFVIKGFSDYGYEEDAQRVAVKIANSYANIFEKEGVFLERIDVLKGTRPEEDGKKYPVQEGFLWTNSLYTWILSSFLQK